MKIRRSAFATIAVAALGFSPLAGGQDAVFDPPRLPDGRPDLNGIWQALNEANFDLEAHTARPAMDLRAGPYGPLPTPKVLYLGAVGAVPAGLGVVEGGTIPYRAEALAIRDENRANWIDRDPEVKCYLPGVPRATYMPHPLQIFQSETAFFIAYEYAGAVRNVYLEKPSAPTVQSWMGESVGHWEGDTFVVEAAGFNDQSWFDRSGNFHSADLQVTERYMLTSPNVITYSATIEDEQTFTRPWTITMPLYRRLDRSSLLEFKCVEFVEELIFGEWRKNPLER